MGGAQQPTQLRGGRKEGLPLVARLGLGAVLGASLTAVAYLLDGGAREARRQEREELELNDPPAPNTRRAAPEVYRLLGHFVGPLYTLCIPKHRNSYKNAVRTAIKAVEAVMTVAVMQHSNPQAVTPADVSGCSPLARFALYELGRTPSMFNDKGMAIVREYVDGLNRPLFERVHDIEIAASL